VCFSYRDLESVTVVVVCITKCSVTGCSVGYRDSTESNCHFQHKEDAMNGKNPHGKCSKCMAHRRKVESWGSRLLAARCISNGAL
jgi:hypothetical protein